MKANRVLILILILLKAKPVFNTGFVVCFLGQGSEAEKEAKQ